MNNRIEMAATAELKQLGDIPIDDVLASMDEGAVDCRALYYRWERQQWSAGDIDFDDDRRQWHEMFGPDLRGTFVWTLAPFYVGRAQVADALVPFVDAAPTEEQQVFLTTQLVDEARHTVFLDRFYSEVIGSQGTDMRARVEAQMPQLNEGSRVLLLEMMPDVSRRIREDRDNLELLVEGIVLYHLVIEAMLALTVSRFLLNFTREAGFLPGFRQGFTAVARDECRHVLFGVTVLKEMIEHNARYADVVRTKIDDLTPIVRTVMEPLRGDASYWGPVPYGADDLITFALNSLVKRLRSIGVSV
ncbi:MAG: ribonucleotide-diphosphate reductase subunit beta [Actinomycetota bacterium]|nr:ribonucleotide-diphosphate reductase subunit beta [Actinomycetota bacterium]